MEVSLVCLGDDHFGCEVIVLNEEGLHVRPARKMVELANQFYSEVYVSHGQQRINGRSIIEIVTLFAEQGARLHLEARGPDAREVLSALVALFADGFPEE